tara:strand:+ start:131 stop:307 length:177 start_codon:yes stop_codon:yes gene_type:complete
MVGKLDGRTKPGFGWGYTQRVTQNAWWAGDGVEFTECDFARGISMKTFRQVVTRYLIF